MKSGVWVQNTRLSMFDVVSIWSERKAPPSLHLHTFRPVDSSHRSTSGYYQQTWDVSYKSFIKISQTLHKYLYWMTQSLSRWHFTRLDFHLFQSQWPSSQRPWFLKQDFSKSWMSHPSALSILSSQTVAWGEGVHASSYRAHWSELVNRSLPAHWLWRRVEDCAGAPVGSNCQESVVLLLTCAAALSLTHWQSALYVWKWAIITIICVPSLVFYNSVITWCHTFLYLQDASFPLPPLFFHFAAPSPLLHLSLPASCAPHPFSLPSSFTKPPPPSIAPSSHAIYLIYTLTHPDDRNRCTINYALKYIFSVLRLLPENASLHCTF